MSNQRARPPATAHGDKLQERDPTNEEQAETPGGPGSSVFGVVAKRTLDLVS